MILLPAVEKMIPAVLPVEVETPTAHQIVVAGIGDPSMSLRVDRAYGRQLGKERRDGDAQGEEKPH